MNKNLSKNAKTKFISIAFLVCLITALIGCKENMPIDEKEPDDTLKIIPTDYSNIDNWGVISENNYKPVD